MYLKYLEAPSIYGTVQTDTHNKIELAKDISDNIIKNIPPENY